MSSEVGLELNKIQYQYVPRMQNQIADALATMASIVDGPKEDEAIPIVVEQKEKQAYCASIEKDEGKNWEVETANKNIGRILRKSTKNYKDWNLQLPYALWGYRTSIQSSTGATHYSLVYGMEAVLPIEIGICSLRTVLESEIPGVDWLQSRYDQFCMMDEKRLKALYHIQGYQTRLRKAFDKKVRTRDLKLGDLVLNEIRTPIQETKWKFKQNWIVHILSSRYTLVEQ
ncbi:uncharacterized protein LOC136062366 [Quercus suber]|uniref:uncharacterized protein LOC136062366 n=1 Tax=Quercus suber TaxID=58331 RepID=UPI0032DF53DA